MNFSLNTVIVDDSPFDSTMLKDLLRNSTMAHVSHVFNCPKEFIEKAPTLEFDLCLLDVVMPDMDGFTVAQLLQKKPIIFVTGVEDKLKEALALNPVDVITKPLNKKRLDCAIEKAYHLQHLTKEYGLFNVAECNRRHKIHLPDIMMVTTDEVDPRHKIILLKNGTSYTIMDCSLDYLLEISPRLVQVNKAALVSLEAVKEVEHDLVSIDYTGSGNSLKELTLSRAYREQFCKRFFYKI